MPLRLCGSGGGTKRDVEIPGAAAGGANEETVTIVGVDEVDPLRRRVSWISPVARALMKTREGDTVMLRTPAGVDELEVLEVRYLPIE